MWQPTHWGNGGRTFGGSRRAPCHRPSAPSNSGVAGRSQYPWRSSCVAAILPAQSRVAARRTWLQANRQVSRLRRMGPRGPSIAALARRCPAVVGDTDVLAHRSFRGLHDASDLLRLICACPVPMQLTTKAMRLWACAQKSRDLAQRTARCSFWGSQCSRAGDHCRRDALCFDRRRFALASHDGAQCIPMALRCSASHDGACLWRVRKKPKVRTRHTLGSATPLPMAWQRRQRAHHCGPETRRGKAITVYVNVRANIPRSRRTAARKRSKVRSRQTKERGAPPLRSRSSMRVETTDANGT